MKRLFLTCLLAGVAALGCAELTAVTVAPAGTKGEIDRHDRTITLSPGVALAFTCRTFGGGPCAPDGASVDDATVARVHPAHLHRTEESAYKSSKPTSYVIVGLEPGTTTLRIAGEKAVTVVVEK